MQNQFTLNLTAPQADTLEDALLTFCPTAKPRIAPTEAGFCATNAPSCPHCGKRMHANGTRWRCATAHGVKTGRKPAGERAMTDAERKARQRALERARKKEEKAPGT